MTNNNIIVIIGNEFKRIGRVIENTRAGLLHDVQVNVITIGPSDGKGSNKITGDPGRVTKLAGLFAILTIGVLTMDLCGLRL